MTYVSEKEPIELVVKGSDKTVAWACGVCRIVAAAADWREGAIAHCGKSLCQKCRTETRKGWLVCDGCRDKEHSAKEAEQFERAKKVSWRDYTGPFYLDDRYFADHDALLCHLEDLDEDERPSHAWACDRIRLTMSASGIVENALDEHHEDASDEIGETDVVELQALLDAWCAKQSVESWEQDTCTVVDLAGFLEEVAS